MTRTRLTITIPLSLIFAILILATKAYCFDYKDIDIELNADVSTGYDDNITYLKNNKKDDFVTNLSLGVSAAYETKTAILECIGSISQQIFGKESGFNNSSQNLTVNFQKEFSRYERASLKNVFSHEEEPRSFEDEFGRNAGRYSYYKNRFNFDIEKDISKQLSLSAKYTNGIDKISREGSSDSYLNKIGIEADYFASSNTVLLGSYDFTVRKFDPGADAFKNTITTGIKHYLTTQLYFDAKAGVDFIESYNDKNYTQPMVSASITNEIDKNTYTSLSFAKEYYTNPHTEDLFDYWQTAIRFSRKISRRLRCFLFGFYGEGEYVSLNITDQLRGASIALSYNLKKNMELKLTHTYSDTQSTVDTREYTRNVTSFGLNMNF